MRKIIALLGILTTFVMLSSCSGSSENAGNGGLANYAYYEGCFGDLSTVETRETNPEVLIRKLKEKGTKIPDMFLCCGTEDFLIEPNRAFHRFLTEEQVPHEFYESQGVHDGVFWAEYEPKALAWLFRDELE